jgi:Spy/CpxP family protein refolding chaperone
MAYETKKRLLPLLTATVFGLLLTAPAMGGGMHGWGDDPGKIEKAYKAKVDKVIKAAKATDEQKTKIYAIRDRLLPDLQKLAKDKSEARKEFQEAWKQPQFDAAKLNATVDRIGDEYRAFCHKVVEAKAELHGILTPEQRGKVLALWEKEHKEWKHGYGKGEKPSKAK